MNQTETREAQGPTGQTYELTTQCLDCDYRLLTADFGTQCPECGSQDVEESLPVRTYEFEGGLLHLACEAACHMTNEHVAEFYGAGKGKLLNVQDGEMPVAEFKALADFRDQ